MKHCSTSDRLKQIIKERNIKQVEILALCQPYCKKYNIPLKKNDLSQYVSGKVEPKQDKLSILGMALNVNEVWLMGYNVPAGREDFDELTIPTLSVKETIEKQYGDFAVQALELFTKLDTLDQGRAIGNMEEMLKNEKYRISKESSGKKAM